MHLYLMPSNVSVARWRRRVSGRHCSRRVPDLHAPGTKTTNFNLPPMHRYLCPVSSPRDAHNHAAKPPTMQPRFTKTPAKTTLQQMHHSTIRLACSLYYMVLSAPRISSPLPFSPPSSLPVPPFTQPNACYFLQKKGIASKMQKKARTKRLTKESEQRKMRTSNKM